MKGSLIHIAILISCIICIINFAKGQNESLQNQRTGRFDTLSLSGYLNLFDAPFTREFNLKKIYKNGILKSHLSYSVNTQLQNLKLRLTNGYIMSPNIYGWAYSFRKITSNHFWLIYYVEGEVLTHMDLRILDIKKKSISEPYNLSSAGGDQGDWEYLFGRFLNDSTYKFINVWGDTEMTKDSILGIDRIRLNGDTIHLTRKNLKK